MPRTAPCLLAIGATPGIMPGLVDPARPRCRPAGSSKLALTAPSSRRCLRERLAYRSSSVVRRGCPSRALIGSARSTHARGRRDRPCRASSCRSRRAVTPTAPRSESSRSRSCAPSRRGSLQLRSAPHRLLEGGPVKEMSAGQVARAAQPPRRSPRTPPRHRQCGPGRRGRRMRRRSRSSPVVARQPRGPLSRSRSISRSSAGCHGVQPMGAIEASGDSVARPSGGSLDALASPPTACPTAATRGSQPISSHESTYSPRRRAAPPRSSRPPTHRPGRCLHRQASRVDPS